LVEDGNYLSAIGITNAENANGSPDGILTNGMYGSDSLSLQYTSTKPNSEICVSLGFNNLLGAASIQLNEKLHYAINEAADTLFTPQQFCFKNETEGDVLVAIKEVAYGGIKVDGSFYQYCPVNCDIFEASISTSNESNFLAKDGTANLNLTNGTEPYTYIWSNGATTATATNLGSGNYSVEISDANDCVTSQSVVIQTANCPLSFVQTNLEPLPSMQIQVKDYIQSNGFVDQNMEVSFKAEDYIELNNNFEVLKGAEFEIGIEVCE